MKKYQIPTADYHISLPEEAKAYVLYRKNPVVIKEMASPRVKGYYRNDRDRSLGCIELIMVKKEFGDAGTGGHRRIASGEEASFMVFTDGDTILPMSSAQDHKAIYDGQRANTGEWGLFSSPVVSSAMSEKIMKKIRFPL